MFISMLYLDLFHDIVTARVTKYQGRRRDACSLTRWHSSSPGKPGAEGRRELFRESPQRGNDSCRALEAKQKPPGTIAIISSGEGGGGKGDPWGWLWEAIFSEEPALRVKCLNTCSEILVERLVVLTHQLRRTALMPNYLLWIVSLLIYSNNSHISFMY